MNIRRDKAFALPTVLIISIIMLSVLVSAVSSTSSTRVALMNQHYDELSRQAADAGVVYAKACIAADSEKTPRWSDAKPLMPNTDCNGDVTHVCTETSTDPECSVLVTDNNKTITYFTVPKPNPDSKGVYKDIHANGHTKLFRTNGELWRDYASKSSTPLASLLKVDLPPLGTPLADCTWEQIGAIADLGKGDDYWNIGDTKDMTLTTGEVLTMQIYDFNHDDKSDGSGRANITFGTKNLMDDKRDMVHPGMAGGHVWNELNTYIWLNNTLKSYIPNEIRDAIKPVNKISHYKYNGTINTVNSEDSIFLFSESELTGYTSHGFGDYVNGEGEQYGIFNGQTDYRKFVDEAWSKTSNAGYGDTYYLRTNGSDYLTYDWVAGMTGKVSNNTQGDTYLAGVCFGFAIGNAPKYRIAFDTQGGNTLSAQNIEVKKTITKPADPVKSGYVLTGWYKEPSYENRWNFTTDKVTADTTLYAKWAPVPPTIGTPLESFTWDQISYISETGQADTYFDIGNEKTVNINGTSYIFQIYDFNHDDKSDNTGKAGITFGMKGLYVTKRAMNPVNTNNYGWDGSDMRAWLNGVTTTNQVTNYATSSVYSQLPNELRAAIKTVGKYTSGGNNDISIKTSNDKIFLFSEKEVFGSSSYSVANEGIRYPIFPVGDQRPRKKYYPDNSNGAWTLRSPVMSSSTNFNGVDVSGDYNFPNGYSVAGFLFGFCI